MGFSVRRMMFEGWKQWFFDGRLIPTRVAQRIRLEGMVAKRCVRDMLAAGYSIDVNDGEETTICKSKHASQILDAMFTSDEDYLIIHDSDGNRLGWVYFVYGNEGWDVISDYTTSLEHVMKGVNKYSEDLEARICA
jgi:hypothetical protein